MISKLRKHASGNVAKFFLILLVASFAVWGIGDALRSTPSYVIKVDNVELTPQNYMSEIQAEAATFQSKFGYNITPADLKNPNVLYTLTNILDNKLIKL